MKWIATLTVGLLAGCASPLPAQSPGATASSPTPDWVAGAAHPNEDMDFTASSSGPKAKGDAPAPAIAMKVDAATADAVKSTRLHAAR